MRLWPKHKHKWRSIRTIWPYPDGYGTYCRGCRTVVDTGLSKPEAEARAKEMNHAGVR
jgi:hypothetical protein